MVEVRTVHTYKELNEIAGAWTTREIQNNYIIGTNSFTIRYKGNSLKFQNDNLLEVASAALQYNGLSWDRFISFNPKAYY